MADPNRADNEDPLGTLRDITDYSWGMPAGYNNQHLILAGQEAKHEQTAMDMLRLAMADQKEISPTQGMAAALLAAIPTLGGALIGRSVGRPNIPEGSIGAMNYEQFSKMMGPHPVVSGAALGQKVSSDYLGSLEEQKAREASVAEKQASIELNRAAKAGSQDAAIIQAGLGKQAEESLLDKRLAAEMPLRERQLANEERRLNYYEQAEARRAEGQDIRLSGLAKKPPSESTKKAAGAAIGTLGLINRYTTKFDQLAAKDPSYLERNIEKVLPATEIGQLQKDLSLLAVQLRNAREAGIMTEQDYQRYNQYLTIGPLDTLKSFRHRLEEIKASTTLGVEGSLRAAKAGGERTEALEDQFGLSLDISYPTLGGESGVTSSTPSAPAFDKEAYKEQYKAKRRAERAAAGAK